MALTRVKLERFTAFDSLDLELSPGINVFIGANGTGKTHLMKVCYAACDVSKTGASFSEKLVEVFLPSNRRLGRLVKRRGKSVRGAVEISRKDQSLRTSFSNHTKLARSAQVTGAAKWAASSIESVYIPVKEMLSNAPGFRSLYSQREIHFEAVYADILQRAYKPLLRGPVDQTRKRLLDMQKAVEGKVSLQNEEFFLRNRQGNLEFTLLAEGMRKLGLLWLLIQNGTLSGGSVMFWDEPETNLNPKLFGTVMETLLELQRIGVQIFFATHDYVILKELDLRRKPADEVAFHSLYRSTDGKIECDTVDNYLDIHPNAIADAFDSLYDREVKRSIQGMR
ncbi:MAG: AAA family ATPase [Chloroflexi bacterium]|nr:AAA family ATPase [Chloroflexota bacterium]MCY3939401.1 AAA family ATPase [Chloroflexota bacterium]